MKYGSLLICVLLALNGCRNHAVQPDTTPPGAPTGLSTITGDNSIELFWNSNQEKDLSGYNVFVSSSYDGRYELIGSTRIPQYLDKGAVNGNVYYYAVTAFDFDGNESELSKDVAYDIPRPEGVNVILGDYRQDSLVAGYDFSRFAVVPFDDEFSDMFFENYQGTYYMDVRTDADIQDMGPTASIDDVTTAPSSGWSPTHDLTLTSGHTYVVWTWDDHFAKFRVTNLSPSRVVFDWVYQSRPSTPLLRQGGHTRPQVVIARP